MREWFFWVHFGLQDLSDMKFSIHEAIIEQIQTVRFIGMHGFQMPLVCSKGVGWANMGYLIPEVAPGDWAIESLEVQIPIYAPMCPLLGRWGITLIGALKCLPRMQTARSNDGYASYFVEATCFLAPQ